MSTTRRSRGGSGVLISTGQLSGYCSRLRFLTMARKSPAHSGLRPVNLPTRVGSAMAGLAWSARKRYGGSRHTTLSYDGHQLVADDEPGLGHGYVAPRGH